MAGNRIIELKGTAPSSATVEFLRAEVPAMRSPFVRIWYALHGQQERYALRLDLDKRVFLDHLENPGDDDFVQKSAEEIANILSDEQIYADVS